MREYTRLTVGDSLDFRGMVQSSPATAPALRSTFGLTRDPPEDLVELRHDRTPEQLLEHLSREYTYVEAQYMGGLTVDDIAEVWFEASPPADVAEALDALGIAWRIATGRI